MASKRIRVMVSSRCTDRIRSALGGSIPMSDLRLRIKQQIEAFQIFGYDSFECWVHEDEPAMDAGADFWDQCIDRVRKSDIVLVLYNGDAGFANEEGDVGICHAELKAAIDVAGARVRLIDVQQANADKSTGKSRRDRRFQDYVGRQQQLGKRFAANDEEAKSAILEALQDAVVEMVRLGSASARKSRFDTGSPLDWSRLDFGARKAAIEGVLRASLVEDGAEPAGPGYVRAVDGVRVYFSCHAVPAAMTIAAAREMVGRPFLRDHELIQQLKDDICGPVHLIGCHKGVTENQASNLLGFPDATIVTPAFGVYVADNIQKIQLVLLANCRDESSTRFAAQRFFDWLLQSGEAPFLANRAHGRKAIVAGIAANLKPQRPSARASARR